MKLSVSGHSQNPLGTELSHWTLCLCIFRTHQSPEEMQGKGKKSQKKRVESSDSEKGITVLSIYWWEIKVTMLSNNMDSLHYLLPQSPVSTAKLGEKTPQNQHIELPMYLILCWKSVLHSAVWCRLSSCFLMSAALQGKATPLLSFVTCDKKIWGAAHELETEALTVGIRHSHSMFSPLNAFIVASNRSCCCERNLGVWGTQCMYETLCPPARSYTWF